jgi:hypothetical protein
VFSSVRCVRRFTIQAAASTNDDGDTLGISIPCAFLVVVVEGNSMLCFLLINFIRDIDEGEAVTEALPGLGLSCTLD